MKSLADILWTVVRWSPPLVIAAFIAVSGIGSGRVNEEIRRRIEARLQREFPELVVRVEGASLVEGEGIVARGVALADPALPPKQQQLVLVEEAWLHCGTTLAELASGEPQLTGLRLRRPVVQAGRRADGGWTIAALRRRSGGEAVPVTIEDATLIVEDAGADLRLTLRQIRVDLRPDPVAAEPDRAAVAGSVAGDLFERVHFAGTIRLADGWFDIAGGVESLDLSPRLHALLPLPQRAAEWLAGLRGRVDCDWRTCGSLHALADAVFTVSGRVESGHFEHPSLPFAVSNATAGFRADRSGLVCEHFEAHAGATMVRGSGRLSGWRADADGDLHLEAERLLVGRNWGPLLPPALAAQWSRLLPVGEIDLRADVARRGGVIEPDVAARCRNVSLTYYRFPYRLDRTVGTVTYKGRALTMHLTGEAGGHPVHVTGALDTGPKGSLGTIEVRGEGMQIDDALLAALPPKSADIVRSLHGAGSFDFVFRHERSPQLDGGYTNSLGIRLVQCSLCYAGFPYPLANVSGTLAMERGRWTIREITGTNDTGVIRCTGSLEPLGADDGLLALELSGRGVVLERELRDALPPGMRRIWDDVDPRGNAGFTAAVRYRVKARDTDVRLEAAPEGDTVSIEPAWFPYRLERLRGRLSWQDGRLRFDDVRGTHDRTTVAAAGACRFSPDGGWRVSFERLSADRFRADHDVLRALPEGLRRPLAAVRLAGLLSLEGGLDIYTTSAQIVRRPDGRTESLPGPTAAAWDLRLDLEQAALDLGVPLEHVHGGISLRGQSDGVTWRTSGGVDLDSAICRGVQLTAVRGPVTLDAAGVRFGALAAAEPGRHARLSARVAGGTLLLDGSVIAAEPGGFTVTATLADSDLERLVADVGGGPHRYRGRVFGAVEVNGSRAGVHALSGRGQLQLRDADIYELSVIVALLKMLRIKPPDRNAFSTSVVDFRIEGRHAYLDNIELAGDAISLVGAGEIDLDSNIHLTFRSIMGDSQTQLPAMKRLLGGASGQFLLVHVDGTLSDPVPTTEAFPTLAAAVQKLQSQRRGGAAERLAARREAAR